MPIRFRMIRVGSRVLLSRAAVPSEGSAGNAHFTGARPLRRCSRTGMYDGFGRANRSRVVDAPRCANFRQRGSIESSIAFRIGPSVVTRRKPASSIDRSISGQPPAASRTSSRRSCGSTSTSPCACRGTWRWHRMRRPKAACECGIRNSSAWGGVRGGQSNPRRGIPFSTATRRTSAAAGARRVDHRSCRFLLSSIVSNSSYCAVGCWSAPGAW